MGAAVYFGLMAAALGAWVTAVYSALSLVRLAPKGRRLSAYFDLGWWRFDRIVAAIGPQAAPHAARYRRSVLVFFGCVLLAFAMTILSAALS